MRDATPLHGSTVTPPSVRVPVTDGSAGAGAGLADRPVARAVVRDDAQPASADARLLGLLAHLRECVIRHVHERRDAGVPVERVLGEVRCLVREAESCEGWRDPSDAVMAQVVWWSIGAYHDEPESPRTRHD